MADQPTRPTHPLAVGICGCPLYLDTKLVEHQPGCPFPQAAAEAEKWNAWFDRRQLSPLGAPVRYWTGTREGPGAAGVTRTGAEVLGGHTAVLWVEGVPGAIALTHVVNTTARWVDTAGEHWHPAAHDQQWRSWLRCEETDRGVRSRDAVESEFGPLAGVGVDHD